MTIPVRFQEYERYDITRDANVVMFMATTDRGCFHAEVQAEGHKALRESRAKFREAAIELIVSGREPCKVAL